MPRSKTSRKSRSGQSRKVNRLKNGNQRYRPGMGPIPGAPTYMEQLGAQAFQVLGELGVPGEEIYRPKPLPGGSRKDPGRVL